MNKKFRIAYITLFIAACAAPLACLPIAKTDDTSENRQLSEMPSFVELDGSPNLNWSSQFETYFSEHFAFRSQLVTAGSLIKSEVFKTSSNEKVIVGNNGWLYFAETLPDYTGENSFSDRKLRNTAKTIALMQEHFEADERSFLFFCAPNKSSVYPQNMPARYIKGSGETNLQRLAPALEKEGVNFIELAPLFKESGKVLYLERDSHWTNEGALLAYNAAADALGMEHDDFSGCSHSAQKVWHADLDGMLFPSCERLSDQEVYDIDFTFDYRGSFSGEDDILIKTKSDSSGGNLLMYRDSFGRAFYPYAAENSKKALFSRAAPYKTSLADDVDARYVILEIVERNLSNITEYAPVMFAPKRDMDFTAHVDESDKNVCETSLNEKTDTLFIHGRLDEKYFTTDSDIYVTLENDHSIFGFEAFPICEEDKDCDFGYSLRIECGDDIPAGKYDIYAYIKNGDEYICTDVLGEVKLPVRK